MQETWFDPWVREIPWRREWQPALVFSSGKSHRQRSLEGCRPWGTESWMWLSDCAHWFPAQGGEVSRWLIPSYALLIWLAHSFRLSQTPCCHLFIPNSWIKCYFPFIHRLYSMKFQLCLLGKVDISKSKLGVESDGGRWSRGQSGRGMKTSRSVRFAVGDIYLHLQTPSA